MSERPERNLSLEMMQAAEAAGLVFARYFRKWKLVKSAAAKVMCMELQTIDINHPSTLTLAAWAERWRLRHPPSSIYREIVVRADSLKYKVRAIHKLNQLMRFSQIDYTGASRQAEDEVDEQG